MSILSFLVFFLVSAICAWLAEAVVPHRIPGGFLTATLVGLMGAWMGRVAFGHVGPEIAGIPILPTMIGSSAVVLFLGLLIGRRVHTI